MSDIRVILKTPVGSSHEVEMPDDVPIGELMPELLSALGLPAAGPDGAPARYILFRMPSGPPVPDSASLLAEGVRPGDALHLVPRVVAG